MSKGSIWKKSQRRGGLAPAAEIFAAALQEDPAVEAEREEAGGMGQLGNVFGAPDVMQKIAANPSTAPLLADPEFMMKIEELKRDPNSISKHLGDQRILSVMGMLMGVNIQTQVVKLDSN